MRQLLQLLWWDKMKKTILVASLLLLAGCDTQYRYFCQDPANWESEQCKKPLCEVNRDCPEHVFKDAVPLQPTAPTRPPAPPAPKGECV
jgi:hypothetical protein